MVPRSRDAHEQGRREVVVRSAPFAELDPIGDLDAAAPGEDLEVIIRMLDAPRLKDRLRIMTLRRRDALRERREEIVRLVRSRLVAMLRELRERLERRRQHRLVYEAKAAALAPKLADLVARVFLVTPHYLKSVNHG